MSHATSAQTNQVEVSRTTLKMGSRFEIIAVTHPDDSLMALKAIETAYQEIDRIESLISSWKPTSQTSLINSNAGKAPVKVAAELFDLIYRSIKVSELTGGAYDISFAGTGDLWRFEGQEQRQFPDSVLVKDAIKRVSYQNIILNREHGTVYLKQEGMKIGFGSIGKGYAANRAMQVMKDLGIKSGMVNAGGDLVTWGPSPKGKEWPVGIADPNQYGKIFAWLSVKDLALVTSGDYQKFFTYNGTRYGHIIDPKTGYPVTGIKSVSILCPDAELADALATGVYVLGAKRGMELIDRLNQVEGLIITSENTVLQSKNLTLNYYTPE